MRPRSGRAGLAESLRAKPAGELQPVQVRANLDQREELTPAVARLHDEPRAAPLVRAVVSAQRRPARARQDMRN